MVKNDENKPYIRKTQEPHYMNLYKGHHIFIRYKDKAISCAYKYENCECSKNKKWFNSEKRYEHFSNQHGLEN